MYGYKMFSIAETNDYITGRCEEDEVAPRSVNSNGASALSLFTSCNPFSEFVGTGSYSAYNSALNTEETLTATSSSIISQKDADNKALLAAAVKAQCYADGIPEAGQECNAAQSVSVTVQCTGGLRVHKVPIPVTWECFSATGEGYIYGFSAYDDGTYDYNNPTAWTGQYRKWTKKKFAVSPTNDTPEQIEYLTTIQGDCQIETSTEHKKWTVSGEVTIDKDGTTYAQQDVYWYQLSNEPQCSIDVDQIVGDPPFSIGSCYGQAGQVNGLGWIRDCSTLTITRGWFQNECDGSSFLPYNVAYEFILEEVGAYKGILDGDVESTGNNCVSFIEESDVTHPGWKTPIHVKGTGVKIKITIGTEEIPLRVGVDYTIIISVSNNSGVFKTERIGFNPTQPSHEIYYYVPYIVGEQTFVSKICLAEEKYIVPTCGFYPDPPPGPQIQCPTDPVSTDVPYPPDQQSITASFSVPSGAFCAQSQVQADQLAYNYAIEQATAIGEAQLDCVYPNEQQSYTASCEGTIVGNAVVPAGAPIGDPVTVIIPAGTYYSDTVAHANAIALAEAQAQAEEQLSCFWTNTPQTANYCCEYFPDRCASVTVPFNRYNSTVSQADANNLAYAAALLQAEALVYCLSDISDGGGETIII
jgi:hypothetical protein